jgi:hypothetical protein
MATRNGELQLCQQQGLVSLRNKLLGREVLGSISRNFTGAGLVIRDVCDRHSKLAGACRCTPGSVVRNLVFYKDPGKFLLMCDDVRISPSSSTLERVLSMMHLPKLPGGRADAAD